MHKIIELFISERNNDDYTKWGKGKTIEDWLMENFSEEKHEAVALSLSILDNINLFIIDKEFQVCLKRGGGYYDRYTPFTINKIFKVKDREYFIRVNLFSCFLSKQPHKVWRKASIEISCGNRYYYQTAKWRC